MAGTGTDTWANTGPASTGSAASSRASLIAAALLFIIASLIAWWQPPRPLGPEPSLAETLLSPVEINAEDRLPAVGVDLGGIALSGDGQRAVAVGDSGTILASSDGGQRWTKAASSTSAPLTGIALSGNGQRAVAVGHAGTILTSSDGGQRWTRAISGTSATLTGIALSGDGQRAMAVGDDGTILTSSDGGQRWTRATSGTSAGLGGIALSGDGQRAVVVGQGGTILASSDGGQRWTRATSDTNALPRGIALSSDGQRAVAVGDGGTILTSRDGGQRWTTATSGTRAWFNGIALSGDGQRALAVGEDGSILTSNDGGQRWTKSTSGTGARLDDVALSGDGQRAVAVGDNGTILTSSDGGQRWTSGTGEWLRGIALSSDGKRAVAVGDDRTILASRDGGQNWNKATNTTGAPLIAIALSGDGQRAVAVGDNGTILTSREGDQRWTKAISGTTAGLGDVALSGDGQRAVAVADDSTILASSDGGQRWTSATSGTSGTSAWLDGIALSGDGQRSVAVGFDGTILTSSDGGQRWTRATSGTIATLRGIALSGDGQRAVAVGDDGTILTSSDGGQTWSPRVRDYRRYPAPWYGLALGLCALLLWRGFASGRRAADAGAAAVAASDAPAMVAADDRLNFAPLARGISRFLRNRNTTPPLTLAITGEWGSGKSSLMGLLCSDLAARGWRPVWFNAWHHQSEEQLLAALLVAIRDTGVPPVLSGAGLAFRLRLLLLRVRKHPLITASLATLAGLFAFYLYLHHDAAIWSGLVQTLSAGKGKDGVSALAALPGIGTLVGGLLLLSSLIAPMKAFGVDPAALLGSTLGKFRLKDARAQTSFRMRFAEQFAEVTSALATPMVIVIDDLDRCKPQTVLDVMEAVNFLTTSGRCFIIFGMARERVAAALALSFKDIAAELTQFDVKGDAGVREAAERYRRQNYAGDYLEKLINIEIKVPSGSSEANSALLLPRSEPSVGSQLITSVKRWAMLVPLLGGLLLGVALAEQAPEMKLAMEPDKQIPAPAPAAPIAAPAAGAAPTAAMPAPTKPAAAAPVFTPGDESEGEILWYGLALLALAGQAAWLLRRWLRRQQSMVDDSAAFSAALAVWTPVASITRNSPRAIKRFGNRVRYLAMLQQGERLDDAIDDWETRLARWLDRHWARLLRRPGPADTAGTDADQTEPALVLAEHRVVALAAFHAQYGEAWRGYVEATTKLFAPDARLDWQASQVKDAIEGYRKSTGASWPPSPAELDAFKRSLDGVRLAGDVQVIESNKAASPDT